VQVNQHTTIHVKVRPACALIILLIGTLLLVVGLIVSIAIDTTAIKLHTIWEAIFHYKSGILQYQIVRNLRLPRALASALVGACFAIAGAIMQGMTRNPLASPGLLGVNAGAAFALAICLAFYPSLSFQYLIIFSFVGATFSSGLVYGIGSIAKGGLTPVRLALAGVAVSSLLTAFSSEISIYYHIAQDIAFWHAGGVVGANWSQIKIMLPWVTGGMIGAFILSRSITVMSLGEDIATGLGQRIMLVKLAGSIIVLVLAGTAVSVVGPVGFVGLVIPHIVRILVGVNYRWIIPCSAVCGSLLMVWADIGSRVINYPFETPVGALIAIIGVPFFLYLARKERREL